MYFIRLLGVFGDTYPFFGSAPDEFDLWFATPDSCFNVLDSALALLCTWDCEGGTADLFSFDVFLTLSS